MRICEVWIVGEMINVTVDPRMTYEPYETMNLALEEGLSIEFPSMWLVSEFPFWAAIREAVPVNLLGCFPLHQRAKLDAAMRWMPCPVLKWLDLFIFE